MLATAIVIAVNNIQSAIGALVIALIANIKGLIPLNYSLGIKGFYMGFINYIQ
jgi:hypothetical protein